MSGSGLAEVPGFGRAIGTFRHPNPFAIYLTMLLVAAVAMSRHLPLLPRVLTHVLAAPALVALILTLTRTGWLGLIIGVLVIAVLQSKRLLVGLAIGLAVVALAVPSVGSRLSDLSTAERDSGTAGNSVVWPFQYWQETVTLSQGQPITWLGLASVRLQTAGQKQPHNDFVRTTAELGVIGLGAYVWSWWS